MENKYAIQTIEDAFLRDSIEGHTRWVVKLSNGLNVYQDDLRQYEQFDDERRYSSWTRLRDYCLKENIDITSMYLQFRTHKESLPENAEGYYFCKSILGGFGMPENFHFFVTGKVKNGILEIERWKIPELIVTDREQREIRMDDLCLILNSKVRNG